METFECPNCDCKSEYDSLKDIETSGVVVCPSCQTLYDYDTKTGQSDNSTRVHPTSEG